MSTPFIIAVPAKGRLQENAERFFAQAGLELVKPRGARDYRGAIADLPGVEVAYLSAAVSTITCAGLGSRARISRDFRASSLAAIRARMARAACLAFAPHGAVSEAISVACERRIVASSRILSALASSVAPVVVMSTISSAAPDAGAPSVAPRL